MAGSAEPVLHSATSTPAPAAFMDAPSCCIRPMFAAFTVAFVPPHTPRTRSNQEVY